MKLFLITIFLFLSISIFSQEKTLTNQSILDMIELDFSEDIILTKIKTSESDFDTSIEAIKELKEKGASSAIIVEIMNASNMKQQIQRENTVERTGIYYINDSDEFMKILPTVFTGTKTNTLGAAMSYGIASAKIKSVMSKSQSSNIIHSSLPEFWFYFSTNPNDANNLNWWFNTATSPNEFVLAKLNVKKNSRELVTGSVNAYSGSNIGVSEKHVIPFSIEIIDDFTFKVTPLESLEAGEYCFFYQGTIPQGGITNQSVFDFSIRYE